MIELALSTVLVVATAMFHGFGLLVIGRSLRALDHGRADAELSPLSMSGAAYTSAVVLGLLVLSGFEIWFYAIVYLVIGATAALPTAYIFRLSPMLRSASPTPRLLHPGGWSAR